MDPRLLSAYEAELEYLRETAREFGIENEEVAGRLGLKTPNDPDPYVERLLEGVAFLAARVRLKLDDQFPEFTQHLLQAVQPDYLAPTPAMCVVGLEVDGANPVLAEGARAPRGLELSTATPGHDTPCVFVTGHEVDLLPLRIDMVEYLPNRAAAAAASPKGIAAAAEAGLRIRFKTTGGASLASIKVDSLPLFVKGAESTPGLLYWQMLGNTVLASARTDGGQAFRLPAPQPHGFDEDCALLPTSGRSFRGYRILREYFACPERFMFVRLDGLAPVFAAGGDTLEVVLLFDRVAEPLIDAVTADNLRLFCTPAINLFERPLGPIQVRRFDHEQLVTPDRTKPLDFEIYRLLEVKAQSRGRRGQSVSPLYALGVQFQDWGGALCYVTRIRPRRLSSAERAARGASDYVGTETCISLAAPGGPERVDQVQQLSIRALLTNRELPELLRFTARQCEFRTDLAAVSAVTVHRAPSRPRPPLGLTDAAWKVIGHLTANYASLVNDPGGDPELLRSQLQLYGYADDPALRRQVGGIRKVTASPVTRRVQVASEPVGGRAGRDRFAFARGQQVALELDDASYDRGRMFLFSAVIDRFLSEFASVNSFVTTVFSSPEQGEFVRWPPRTGQRPTI